MALMTDSCDSQRDMKFQLDILVSEWGEKRRREERPPSESRFSETSVRSEKIYASSTNSVKEQKRLMEEAKLEMQVLKEKQELQRELERIGKGKTELNRKLNYNC